MKVIGGSRGFFYSVRHMSRRTGVAWNTVHHTLQCNNLYTYDVQVQSLLLADCQQRMDLPRNAARVLTRIDSFLIPFYEVINRA